MKARPVLLVMKAEDRVCSRGAQCEGLPRAVWSLLLGRKLMLKKGSDRRWSRGQTVGGLGGF